MATEPVQEDVRRLFERMGTGELPYHELAAGERREVAAAKWPLLSATNRSLGGRLLPTPSQGGGKAGRKVVAVISLCGGTGRTTVAANLAQALAVSGSRVLAVDLDPQNLLGLHFSLDPAERIGLGSEGLSVEEATGFIARQRSGAAVLPFGQLDDVALTSLEGRLASEPSWLKLRLQAFTPGDCEFVLLDVAAGRNVWTRQALEVADEALVVLAAHPTSYASVPATEAMLSRVALFGDAREQGLEATYLINGFDGRSGLDRDLVASLRSALGTRVLPFSIQRDEVVREALLHRRSVLQEAIDSQVTADFNRLAEWLRERATDADVTPLREVRVAG